MTPTQPNAQAGEKEQHSPTPWRVGNMLPNVVFDANDKIVCDCGVTIERLKRELSEASGLLSDLCEALADASTAIETKEILIQSVKAFEARRQFKAERIASQKKISQTDDF
jgi:hypothetical protein